MQLSAFISSNLKEFGPADNVNSTRRKIANILREFDIQPVMWEDLPKPRDMPVEGFYKRYLGECQIYVGLFGLEESKPTEDEYHESKILHIERWAFICDPHNAQRHPQMQALVSLAKSESVYAEFDSEETLCENLRARVRTFLPEKVAEYIELTKTRAHEFLIDYRKSFLEPLLNQVLIIRTQLQYNSNLSFSDYWLPRSIRVNPYFLIDNELKDALDTFFLSFTKCERITAAAIRAHNNNCHAATEWLLRDQVKAIESNAQNRLLANIEQRLSQINLMNLTDLQGLSNEERETGLQGIRQEFTSAKILPAGLVSERIEMLIDGVFQRNQKDNDVRAYLEARKVVETTSNRAYELLWKKFLNSIGM
jgi:hypothetical protein